MKGDGPRYQKQRPERKPSLLERVAAMARRIPLWSGALNQPLPAGLFERRRMNGESMEKYHQRLTRAKRIINVRLRGRRVPFT